MVRVKASLIFLFLIVPIVRSSQVQANLSMAELEASDANTKYWLQMQNNGRTIGSSCSEDKCVEACAEGWEANGDHCYLFGDEKKNWTAAEDFCRGEGGHLATVNTNATKEFVLEGLTRRNFDWTWIGGNDLEEEGVWKWTDCTPWEATFWAPGEPNNKNNEDCLALVLVHGNPQLNRQWNDGSCIIEWEFLCSKKICSSDNSEIVTEVLVEVLNVLPEEETTLAENTNNSNNEEETTEANNNNGGNNLSEEKTTEAENTNNNNNEEETTETDNNNGGNKSSEEDTSGANVMWKLISSSFAVLLFLLF